MDTLCIPVKPEDMGLRLMSIDMMASIYAAASYVLVLDSELMSLKASMLSKAELLARVLTSVWMCRSWTLQEGVLATHCAVQFQDEIKVLNEIQVSYEDHVHTSLSTYLWENFLQLRSNRETGRVSVDQFTLVWNSLAGRSTTMAEDQYIILANILDIPLLPLIKLKTPSERMQRIVLSLDRVPFSIFCNVPADQSNNRKSRLNSWIPSKVTSDILASKPNLTVHSGFLSTENWFMGLNNFDKDSLLLLDGIVPVSSVYNLTICKTTRDYRFKVEATVPASKESEAQQVSTVLVLEHSLYGSRTTIDGACFYITEPTGNSSSHELTLWLTFCCSLRISTNEIQSSEGLETTLPHYIAKELPEYLNIAIKYGT
jgi:hypothetical protein